MRNLMLLVLAVLSLATPAMALETIQVKPDLALQLEFSQESWMLSDRAPDFLLRETAEHLMHELEAQGKEASEEQVGQIAAKRLSANEAFLYNPESGAVLTIDYSRLRADEKAPGRRAVANSAKYASQGLEQEEGLSKVNHEVNRFDLSGARYAYRIDARFLSQGEPKEFVGIVGFEQPYWIFLYYNDFLRNPRDKKEMMRILDSAVVVPGEGR